MNAEAKMNVLVTGAGGFLGRHVVAALLARGHAVRCLVRSSGGVPNEWADCGVEVTQCDLCGSGDLGEVLGGIDVVVHLAAQLRGTDRERIESTVSGTANLLDAMKASCVQRLVLASSLSVYDWSTAGNVLNEDTPLESCPSRRDGYAVAKLQQEQLVMGAAKACRWVLTVLRPGYIWGQGNDYVPGVAMNAGRIKAVVAPWAPLPLVYVENCADAFALAAEKGMQGVFNVVDSERVIASTFVGELYASQGCRVVRFPVPYVLAILPAMLANAVCEPLGLSRKLPGLLATARCRARFRPMEFSASRIVTQLGWRPRYAFADAIKRMRLASHRRIDVGAAVA